MTPQYSWQPIADYSQAPLSLASAELKHLSSVWQEQRQELESKEGLEVFNERLRREWAIETGLLERVYTLDRGITQNLIEQGIDAALIPHSTAGQDPTRIVAVIRDHEEAIDGLFAFVKGERGLTVSYIKELHALLTRNQDTVSAIDQFKRSMQLPLLRGGFKKQPNNPVGADGSVHEYCPPEHTASEMDRLVELHSSHKGLPPEVEAAWLHHRFTQVHPFQDGNGRVARCLATLVFLKAGWFPLTIRDVRDERSHYLDALEAADHGDLSQLISVFVSAQRRAFVQALGITGQMLNLTRADQVIAAARAQLQQRDKAVRLEWQNARQSAGRLQEAAEKRLSAIVMRLTTEMKQVLPLSRFRVESEPAGGTHSYYFRGQVIELARHLGYYANTNEYHAWTRLVLLTNIQSDILISFHGSGYDFRGIIAVSACFFRREATEEGEREVRGLVSLNTELFQVNYREKEEDVLPRFERWLEEALVKGLEIWKQSL